MLHGLRQRYPSARIDWLLAKPFHELIEGHPDLDDVVLFDRRFFGGLGRRWDASKAFFTFVRDLRRRRYDLVVDLQGLLRTGFLSWATGARVRIGFASAREGATLFYNQRVTVVDPNTHAVDRNYLVAKTLGFEDQPIVFHLPISPDAQASATQLLEHASNNRTGQLIAVVPGARWETKAWLPDRFTKLIDRLHEVYSYQCVLIGGPDDKTVCEVIRSQCKCKPLDLAGKTSLKELAAVLSACDLALCNDSGTVHIATALGKPVVCIVGPTNPTRTGPYRRLDDVVKISLDCSPCYLRKLSQCPHEHRCMTDLQVEQVAQAVHASLERA